jgi:hypothetical protein
MRQSVLWGRQPLNDGFSAVTDIGLYEGGVGYAPVVN